jgi:hypothetical protein
VGDTQIKCAEYGGLTVVKPVSISKIMPKTQGNGRQEQTASAAAVIDHGVVSFRFCDIRHDDGSNIFNDLL